MKLNKLIMELMPVFHRYINPIVNEAEYDGKKLQQNQIKIIAALSLEERLTPGQISTILKIQKGSLTRMLKSLLNLGLIRKERDTGDDRKYYLHLTDQGMRFFEQHQQNCYKGLSSLFGDLNSTEERKIEEGLSVFQSYIKNMEG